MSAHAAPTAGHQPTHAWPEDTSSDRGKNPFPPDDGDRLERAVGVALSVAGLLMLWAGHAWASGWPVGVILLATLSGLVGRRDEATRLGRALAVAAAGGIAALLDPALAPLTLLCSCAVVACYDPAAPTRPGPWSAPRRRPQGAVARRRHRGGSALGDVFDRSLTVSGFAMLGGIQVVVVLGAMTGGATGRPCKRGGAAAAVPGRDG